MRVARFTTDGSEPRFGIVDENDLVVLAGDPLFVGYETTGERVPLAAVRLLAPVIPRSKVVCVGLNYPEPDHELAGSARAGFPPILLKPNTAVVGLGDAIRLPPVEGRFVHEAELVVVVGRIAKQVKRENWADYVFGYTIGNDVSARDQMIADGQWVRGKGYDSFAPIGPWIETEVDPAQLEITSRVDGVVRRRGNTRDMIHGIPELIETLSEVWTLLPGDLIMTGSVPGDGVFAAGQTIEIEVAGIGSLVNPAVNRD